MKLIKFFAICAVSQLVGILPLPADGADSSTDNLVKNPSFEERSGPEKEGEQWGATFWDGVSRSPFAGWGYSGFWQGGDYDIKLGKGHTGKLCVRLVCRVKGRSGIGSDTMRVLPGTKLRFKGYFKAVGAKGGVSFVNFEGDPGDGWEHFNLPEKTDYDWTEVTYTVTVPEKTKVTKPDGMVDICIFIYMQTFGELWIDDITLTPVGKDGI